MVISTKKNKKNGSRTKKKFMKTSLKKKSKFKTKSRKYLNKTNKIMIGGHNITESEETDHITYIKNPSIEQIIEYAKDINPNRDIIYEPKQPIIVEYINNKDNKAQFFYDLKINNLQLIYMYKEHFIVDITTLLTNYIIEGFIIPETVYTQIKEIKDKEPWRKPIPQYYYWIMIQDIEYFIKKIKKPDKIVINTIYISRVFTVLTNDEIEKIKEEIKTDSNKNLQPSQITGNNNNLVLTDEELEMFDPKMFDERHKSLIEQIDKPDFESGLKSDFDNQFGFESIPNSSQKNNPGAEQSHNVKGKGIGNAKSVSNSKSNFENSFGFNNSPTTSTSVSSKPAPASLKRKSSLGNYGFGNAPVTLKPSEETQFGFNV